jgi:hypothetical protein
MKKLLLLSILLLFISCKKNEFENLLTGENKKWCYVNSNKFDKNAKPIYFMKFNKNGKSENRMIRNSERAFEFEKLENNCNWRYYENDSVFEVCGFKFKVLKFENDTIRLFEKTKNFNALFVNIKN